MLNGPRTLIPADVVKRLAWFAFSPLSLSLSFSLLAACDPSTSISRLGISALQRNGLITECCNCLDREVYVENPAQVCPEVDVDRIGDGVRDGGCADAGLCVASELSQRTPCMCGITATTCRDRLAAGEEIVVVGRCLDRQGECTSDCAGVLAFPDLDG